VRDAFEILRNNAPAIAAPIFNYFRDTYVYRIVNGVEMDGLFIKAEWNMHQAVLADMARTNNSHEGYANLT